MKIVICASIDFTYKVKEISDKLLEMGFETEIPFTSKRILSGELSLEDFKKEKEANGDANFRKSTERKIKDDVIKKYFNKIGKADAMLVVNIEKNSKKNYIGGNTFLEIGFAHVLDKKIFLLNPVPENSFKDEILAMQPEVIYGDLSKIKL